MILLLFQLTVHGSVDRALANHPSVAAARALRDRAAADRTEARTRVSLDASVMRFQRPMLVFPLHSFQTPPTFDRTLFQASLGASWTVFDAGRRGRNDAARALAQSSEAALGTTERALMARTATAYLRLLTARGIAAAQDQRLAALEAEAARVRQLLAEGKAARIHILRVDAERERARADRIATRAQLDVARTDLAQLTGLRDTVLANVRLADTTLPALTPAPAEEAARRTEAAAAAARAARTRLPDVRLTAGYIDRAGAAAAPQGEWQAGIGVSWALWTGGAKAAQIRRANADARAATEQQRLTELNLTGELDRATAAFREARARTVALERAVEQSVEIVRIERLSLDVGTGTQTDYLEAEANLLRTRAGWVEAQHAAIAARVEIARIAGELTPSWLARTLESVP